MITAIHPSQMSPNARLTEAATILATGIRRLLEKRKTENICLDNSPNQWLHSRKTTHEGERG